MDALKILLVDDDIEILQLLSEILRQNAYEVLTAQTAEEFWRLEKDKSINLILLDVMLPDADGIRLCQEVRNKSSVPIILLTANTSESDRVLGLEFGADDYIQKPFNPRELIARIKALFRRMDYAAETGHVKKSKIYSFLNWKVNITTHQLFSPEGIEVPITSSGFELLVLLLEHPQRVLSRDFILETTKNRRTEAYDRSIDIQISRLRQIFKDNSKDTKIIKTIHNEGYLFLPEINVL